MKDIILNRILDGAGSRALASILEAESRTRSGVTDDLSFLTLWQEVAARRLASDRLKEIVPQLKDAPDGSLAAEIIKAINGLPEKHPSHDEAITAETTALAVEINQQANELITHDLNYIRNNILKKVDL